MERKKFDSINVVPFIDIMLVLLVIVLTTASFIQTGLLKLDIPTANTPSEQKPKKELTISIKQTGEIYLDNEPITKENLQSTIITKEKDTPIHINSDKNATFDDFVYILNMLKNNGFDNLGIITKDE